MKRKVIFIVGPTASGKTGVGVRLAKELNGEIVSADSRQVYRGLDIGTGKDLKEYDGIIYHLIDICEPGRRFTLFDYLPLARAAIDDILSRDKLPIVVGGTGLYVQALIEGFAIEKPKILNPKSQTNSKYQILSREQLNNLTIIQLGNLLKKIDIHAYQNIDLKNPHRIIRAIERAQEGNIPAKQKPDFEALQIGIDIPREELHKRIDKRVDERFAEGMLEEVAGLLNKGVDQNWLLGLGLEYRVMGNFLISNFQFPISNKTLNTKCKMLNTEFELMKQQLKYKIHQFARRQLTWFRRFPEIVWENDFDKILKISKKFIN